MPSDAPLAIPGLSGAEPPHFFAPWQAKAFALTVHLNERGLFTWSEWVDHISTRIKGAPTLPDRASDADHAEVYYRAWLDALADLLADKGLAEAGTVRAMTATWQRAAEATPHGTPILYEAGLTGQAG